MTLRLRSLGHSRNKLVSPPPAPHRHHVPDPGIYHLSNNLKYLMNIASDLKRSQKHLTEMGIFCLYVVEKYN